jgi:hypothetical protein
MPLVSAAPGARAFLERWRSVALGPWAGPLALGLAFAVFFAPQLLSSGVPFYRDHLVTNIPLRAYVRERLLSGALPQWYPFESLGVPVIGQIALATFHPFTFLFLPLQPAVAEKASILGANLLALLGAYFLCRRVGAGRLASVTGAMAYAFGGYFQGVSSILAYTLSASALPWMALGAVRVVLDRRWRDASLLGLAWGTVFLSGDAVSFLLSGVLVLSLLAVHPSRRGLLLAATGGLLAALLTAVELLPSTVVAADSVRAVGAASPLLNVRWALHPLRLPELVIPGYMPDGVRSRMVADLFHDGTATFSTSLFAGGLVLALAVLGVGARRRTALPFLGMGLLGAWMSLGAHGGLLPLLQRVLPLLTRFRYPERYLVWTWLGLAVAAGLGLDRLREPGRTVRGLLVASGVAGLLAIVSANVSLAELAWRARGVLVRSGEPLLGAIDQAWTLGLLFTAVLLLAGAAVVHLARRRPAWMLALPALVFLELWHGNGGQFPLADRALVGASNRFVEEIHRGAPGLPRVFHEGEPEFRVTRAGPEKEGWILGMQHLLRSNVAGLYGIASLDSNLGALSVRHAMLLAPPGRQAALAPLLGVPFRIDVGPARPGAQVLAHEEGLRLTLSRGDARGRAFLSGTLPVPDREAAARWLDTVPRDIDRLPWEGGPALAPAAGEVAFVEDHPERVVLKTRSAAPAALVLADEYAPGWTALVDGTPVPVLPALLTLRAVALPPGEHVVRFEYRTPRLVPGLLCSSLALALALLLPLLERVRRREALAP